MKEEEREREIQAFLQIPDTIGSDPKSARRELEMLGARVKIHKESARKEHKSIRGPLNTTRLGDIFFTRGTAWPVGQGQVKESEPPSGTEIAPGEVVRLYVVYPGDRDRLVYFLIFLIAFIVFLVMTYLGISREDIGHFLFDWIFE